MSIMEWRECERRFVRHVTPDREHAASLAEKAMRRVQRARAGTEVEFIVEDYYEAIKELLTAYLLQEGLRSRIHQCLISYFSRMHPEYEVEAQLIQQMSYFRNRLEHYGEDIPAAFLEKNKNDFEEIVSILREIVRQ